MESNWNSVIVEEFNFGNGVSGCIVHKKDTEFFFNRKYLPDEYRCYIYKEQNNSRFYLTSMSSHEETRQYLIQLSNSKVVWFTQY